MLLFPTLLFSVFVSLLYPDCDCVLDGTIMRNATCDSVRWRFSLEVAPWSNKLSVPESADIPFLLGAREFSSSVPKITGQLQSEF